jgi:hypothetical protein
VLARVRSSPYLPGTRSRLWRIVDAAPIDERERGSTGAIPGAAGFGTVARDGQADMGLVGDGQPGRGGRTAGSTPGGSPSSPVLALIRRLPFDEDA